MKTLRCQWLQFKQHGQFSKGDELTQEPPNTCHLSICRCSLNFSISLTRSHVVFSSREADLVISQNSVLDPSEVLVKSAYGVDFPAPLWSNRTIYKNLVKEYLKANRCKSTLYLSGLKNLRSCEPTPPPGPPRVQVENDIKPMGRTLLKQRTMKKNN